MAIKVTVTTRIDSVIEKWSSLTSHVPTETLLLVGRPSDCVVCINEQLILKEDVA